MHPRARGEFSVIPRYGVFPSGASPRARGILVNALKLAGYKGCIPARAGNSATRAMCGARRKLHPRARGEFWLWLVLGLLVLGASPRARGIRDRIRATALRHGCIPARAGNS